MSKLGRSKGHQWERDCAKLLRPYFPDAMRMLEYQQGVGYDLQNTGDFLFQCKCGAKPPPARKVLAELPDEGKIAVGLIKQDRRKPYAVLILRDLMRLLGDYGIPASQEVMETIVRIELTAFIDLIAEYESLPNK